MPHSAAGASGAILLRSNLATPAVVITALVAGSPVQACYSGLVIIPTADLLGPGECTVEAQVDGVLWDSLDDARFLNTQVGLTDRLEAGLDFDLGDGADTRLLLNGKILLTPQTERGPAVAVGICNVGRRLRAMPYLVASNDFRRLGAHAGMASIEGRGRWFIGLDYAVDHRLTLMGDYTNGSENWTSVGCNYQFTEQFGVMAGILLPNASDQETGFSIHAVLGFPLRRLVEED